MHRLIVASLVTVLLALAFPGPTRAQSDSRSFPETGQSIDITHGFLQFWEAHAGALLLGAPVTGVLFEANTPVQYFENARLEARPAGVVVGDIGREYTRWQTFAVPPPQPAQPDVQQFPDGHTIAGSFRVFWLEHDGATMFGAPLSEALWEMVDGANIRVQYFERGRLEQRAPGKSDVTVGKLGRAIATARGWVLKEQQLAVAVPQAVNADTFAAAFSVMLPTPTPSPSPTLEPTVVVPTATIAPTDPPTVVPPTPTVARPAPVKPTPTLVPPKPALKATPVLTARPKPTVATVAGKMIDVNLSKQWLYVYENGVEVYRAPVTTGRKGFSTPTGTYNIYHKLPLRTMRGEANGEKWVVPDVPNVMYVVGGVALHGTYWHNLFGSGQRLSHGCINLSLRDAAWLYKWAPIGTKVVIHN